MVWPVTGGLCVCVCEGNLKQKDAIVHWPNIRNASQMVQVRPRKWKPRGTQPLLRSFFQETLIRRDPKNNSSKNTQTYHSHTHRRGEVISCRNTFSDLRTPATSHTIHTCVRCVCVCVFFVGTLVPLKTTMCSFLPMAMGNIMLTHIKQPR